MTKKNYTRNGTILGRLAYTMAINQTTGCHEWTGATAKGYGRFTYKTKFCLAHRASYEVHKGPIPEKMLVCHHCDNPKCINPDHLFIGTARDNARDALTKGRLKGNPPPPPRGEKSKSAKLTDDLVRQIRQGGVGAHWARELGVSEECIRKCRRRQTWAHLD